MKKASEILRVAREDKKLSLSTVERDTKIKRVFLEGIESGNFERLPSESYAMGFVKNYAKYLEIPVSEIVPLFRREYSLNKHIPIIPEFRQKQKVYSRRSFFSGKALVISLVALIIAGYVLFQYSSLVFAPGLEVKSPRNGQTIIGNVVDVRGKTDPYATVLVNNDEVYVALDGTFKKSVYEFSGDAKITVIAKNRFGKENKKILEVKVE